MQVVERGLKRAKARLLAGLFVVAAAPAVAAPIEVPLATAEMACTLIGGRLQSVGVEQCLNAGLEVAIGASAQGMPLLYRDYPATSRRTTPKRVLMIGGIHGDELSSVSIVVTELGRGIVSKENGSFELLLEAGRYTLRTSSVNHAARLFQ